MNVLRKIDVQILRILNGLPQEKSNAYYVAGMLGKSYNSIYQSFKILNELEFIERINSEGKPYFKLSEKGKFYIEEREKNIVSNIEVEKSELDFLLE